MSYVRVKVELRHLRYFVAVAKELHFGKAAKRLHIVQPALSIQISRLEEELGVELLRRNKRQVRLTEAGRLFFGEAQRILERTEQASEAARRAAQGQIGRLAIGFVGPAVYSIFPDILRTYRKQVPEVDLMLYELNSTEQIEALHEGRIHVGFVRMPVDDEALIFETVYREPVVAVLPEDHPLASREKVPIKMLANEPFVMVPRSREPGAHDHYVSLCREAGFSPKVVQEAHQIHTIVGLVSAGIGTAIVPSSVRNLRRPGAVYRSIKGPSPQMEMATARLREIYSPILDRFLDIVEEVTGEGPEKKL